MDQVDHVASRVTLATFTGLTIGSIIATHRGYSIPRTALSVAFSFALSGTACFGTERIAHHLICQLSHVKTTDEVERNSAGSRSKHYLKSYAIGGFAGGMISGGLFRGRPIAGAALFTPIMFGVGLAEINLLKYREKRIAELKSELPNPS